MLKRIRDCGETVRAMDAHKWYDVFQVFGVTVIVAILLFLLWGPALTVSVWLFRDGVQPLKRLMMDLAMTSISTQIAMIPWLWISNLGRKAVLGPRPKR